ncbi:MAG: MurR/RpiR family transcriptional regulator, partial [Gluconacetobacter diazotrophicus]|nr:MurR/RpiR family transcriptional regulator [Gluconacetobacter diazotrophicus]
MSSRRIRNREARDPDGRPAVGGRNVLELILVRLPELRKSDRRVAEHVLADPQAALAATVAETARRAGVSEPTVMRFCAALGFEGFQDFKIRLAGSVALGLPATQSILDINDTPQAVTDKVFDYTMTSLDWARSQLDHEAVARAIDLLVGANRIEFFGFGASGIVAADAQQKFPLFGIPCGAQKDSHQQFIAAAMMRPGDVAVAIS